MREILSELPYKYIISNKVKEVLYNIIHRCYPVNVPLVIYLLKILNIYFSIALSPFHFRLTF